MSSSTHEILRMNDVKSKIRESEFVEKWLLTLREFIAGGDVEIGVWLYNQNVTIFGEVNVVDNQDNILFVVPSVFIKQDSVLPKTVSSSIGDIMYRAENLNRTLPGKGDAYIRNELTSQLHEQKEMPEYQRRWDEIFIRYKLEPVFSKGAGVSSTYSQDDDEEFDDYEEL